MAFWMDFLANQGLFERSNFQRVVAPNKTLEYLLTPMGEKFEAYRQG
jgi:hypothetical protein